MKDCLSFNHKIIHTLPEGMTEHPGYQSKIQSTLSKQTPSINISIEENNEF